MNKPMGIAQIDKDVLQIILENNNENIKNFTGSINQLNDTLDERLSVLPTKNDINGMASDIGDMKNLQKIIFSVVGILVTVFGLIVAIIEFAK